MGALMRLPAFRNAYLVRGAMVWVALRMGAAFVRISDPNLAQELLICVGVMLAVQLDARRRHEDAFLANLGISPWAIAAWSAPVAIVLEILVP